MAGETPAAGDTGNGGQQQQATWFQGADAETVGHIQNRGWDKLDPTKAALEAVKAHREAERYIGVPANQIIRLPKDANDAAGWDNVWSRLGAGKEAKDYDLSGVKFKDGTALDDKFVQSITSAFIQQHIPKEAAKALAQTVVSYMDEAEGVDAGEAAAKLAAEKDALTKNWGPNYNANLFIAQQAAAKLGIDPEAVKALESQVGYSKVMEMFRSLGERMGEDRYITNNNGGGKGVMTREAAIARKAELMSDTAWTKKYMSGDVEANREMQGLLRIITGEDDRSYQAA